MTVEPMTAIIDSPNMAFYRVVRTGLRIVGLPAGGVVSGVAQLDLELGNEPAPGDPLTGTYVTTSGGPIPGLTVLPLSCGFLRALWDTAAVPNGVHVLEPGVQFGSYTSLAGALASLTVANGVWFPNYYPVAGEALCVEAQTIYPGGVWTMGVFDGTGTNLLAQLEGFIDAEGYCEIDGDPDPTPGFSLSLLDQNGEQFPFAGYVLDLTAFAASGGGSSRARQTNVVERSWWQGLRTYFNVAYQQIYNPSSLNGQNLALMVGNVVGAAITRYPNDPQAVLRGTMEEPFRLQGPPQWATLATDLTNTFGARNLYYFGHGGPPHFGYGGDTNLQINVTDLSSILRNAPDPLFGTNRHPYRFVFLDGCKTSEGGLAPSFGIPKGNVAAEEFTQKRGIRPRAFMGWDKGVMISWGAFDQQHNTFIGSFFDKWANSRDVNGLPVGLRVSIQRANPSGWSQKPHLIIHGWDGLSFLDDL